MLTHTVCSFHTIKCLPTNLHQIYAKFTQNILFERLVKILGITSPLTPNIITRPVLSTFDTIYVVYSTYPTKHRATTPLSKANPTNADRGPLTNKKTPLPNGVNDSITADDLSNSSRLAERTQSIANTSHR